MLQFSGLEFSILEIILIVSVIILSITTIITVQRLSDLKSELTMNQRSLVRELKMVNSASIGLGRRFSSIEKKMTKASSVSSMERSVDTSLAATQYAEIQDRIAKNQFQVEAKKTSRPTTQLKTKAEQSLSSWLTEHQTA